MVTHAGRIVRTYDEQVFCESACVRTTRYGTARVTGQNVVPIRERFSFSSLLKSELNEFPPGFLEGTGR